MKAMILAAGSGTRLRPITDDRPKALAELGGVPLLEIVLRRLRDAGFREFVVNVCHFADMIVDFLDANDRFGLEIAVSREAETLDTGGALKRAREFFASDEPLLTHNVDVLADLDYRALLERRDRLDAAALLAVRRRDTNRRLLFDDDRRLVGWRAKKPPQEKTAVESSVKEEFNFMGVSVVTPKLFEYFPEKEKFSIVDVLLDAASEGERVFGYDATASEWIDVGTPDKLASAANLREDLRRGFG